VIPSIGSFYNFNKKQHFKSAIFIWQSKNNFFIKAHEQLMIMKLLNNQRLYFVNFFDFFELKNWPSNYKLAMAL
jgi:hypothetical protein